MTGIEEKRPRMIKFKSQIVARQQPTIMQSLNEQHIESIITVWNYV